MPEIRQILEDFKAGRLSLEEAETGIARSELDISFARLDCARKSRCGFPEVVFCPGKSTRQVIEIARAFNSEGHNVFATRSTLEQYEAFAKVFPGAVWHEDARAITLDQPGRTIRPKGLVAVLSAGTSDIPAAAEAALTAERMEAVVERVYDVGVAGLHRLSQHIDLVRTAKAVIVVAGMEGALPSVVSGLTDKPVIAVPTSVGYGASFKGVAALLGMLNTCAPGVSVVNIDNGFGAGVTAGLINRQST